MTDRLFVPAGRVPTSDARLRRLAQSISTPPIDGRNNFLAGVCYVGQGNIGFGMNALACAVANTYNIGIGENALYNVTTGGTYNIGIGYGALKTLTTGDRNIAIGYLALTASTTGGSNIAIGDSALTGCLDGTANIAIGVSSMKLTTSGTVNIAIGVQSLYANTTGSSNVAIGGGAMNANVTGEQNVAIGYSSLGLANTACSYCVAIGYYAGLNAAASYRLYIESNLTYVDTPLIYGEFDNRLLKINGSFQVTVSMTAPYFVSNVAIGTAPFQCTSTTLNTNLNADLLDGSHATAFAATGHDLLGSKEHADTLTGTVLQGDIIVGNATPKWSRLAANATSTNKYLRSVSGGVPSWEPLTTVVTKTTTYVLTVADDAVVCNSITAFTVTLPVATGSGRVFKIKNINTGTVTVDGDSSDTIDADSTVLLGQWDSVQLVDYAANKWIIV